MHVDIPSVTPPAVVHEEAAALNEEDLIDYSSEDLNTHDDKRPRLDNDAEATINSDDTLLVEPLSMVRGEEQSTNTMEKSEMMLDVVELDASTRKRKREEQ